MINKSDTKNNHRVKRRFWEIFKTIRGKLTLSFISIFGITLIGFSFVLYNVFAKQSRDDFDIVMNVLASSISETIRENGINQDILNEVKEFNNPGLSAFYGYTEVLNSAEMVVMQSSQLKDISLPLERNRVLAALNGSREIATVYTDDPGNLWDSRGARILYVPATHHQHKYAVILIAPLSSVEGMLANLRLIIFIAIPVTLLIASIVGWVFSKRAYAPVGELVAKTNTITAEKLHLRLKVSDADDEISHLAETLNYMIERLEQSFNTLKQFTSDASHELRTPLTIIRGEIEVALKKPRDKQEYENILKDNLEEVNRLQNIVEGLLTLSQYENNRITIQSEKINLVDIVIESLTKSRILAEKKNIKIILKLEEENPDAIYITGDSRKLMNVFLNIFDNAIKYSNENTEIQCYTGITKTDNFAYVTVKDQGIGIPESSVKNIFERFYREDSSRTRGEGYSLGLGLSIVKAVVEAHGGRIEVKSEYKKGSAFTVYLPYSS
ncbi:MAG: HAMP domain-containing protein [Ignavibacteria bacterium]|nr:HAMP domain-containing protein [Ignavibacteria bacterium]